MRSRLAQDQRGSSFVSCLMSQSRLPPLPFFPKWTSVVTERRQSDMHVELLNMPPIEISSDEDEKASASYVIPEHFAAGSSSSRASQSDASRLLVRRRRRRQLFHGVANISARTPKPTKWGRCMQCTSAMRPIVLPSGRVFLGCSKYQSKNPTSCSWTCAVPPQLYDRLPDRVSSRLRVQF